MFGENINNSSLNFSVSMEKNTILMSHFTHFSLLWKQKTNNKMHTNTIMEKCQALSWFAVSESCVPFKWDNKASDSWLPQSVRQAAGWIPSVRVKGERCVCLTNGLNNLTNYNEMHHLRWFLCSSLWNKNLNVLWRMCKYLNVTTTFVLFSFYTADRCPVWWSVAVKQINKKKFK